MVNVMISQVKRLGGLVNSVRIGTEMGAKRE